MRADRLLSLMLLLQTKGRQTALDLSEQLEVSLRTIYRDLDALSGAGIPVYTQSGPNGGVFLDEHYRVSLNGLSREDVQALFLISEAGPLKDIGLGKSDTLLKLFAALPSVHRDEVERLRQRLYIDPANWFQMPETLPFLPLLQRAVWEDRLVRICYQPVEGGRIDRMVEAYGLVAKANIWYLIGKKTETGEFRNFRIKRLGDVDLCEARFKRDAAFDLGKYWAESCAAYERDSGCVSRVISLYCACILMVSGCFRVFLKGVMKFWLRPKAGARCESVSIHWAMRGCACWDWGHWSKSVSLKNCTPRS